MAIKTIEFTMAQYADKRKKKVDIWTPKGYDKNDKTKRYPVIYMHDGQAVFGDTLDNIWGAGFHVDATINEIVKAGDIGSIVVAIYSQPERERELGPAWPLHTADDERMKALMGTGLVFDPPSGDKYSKFIVETLKPYVDAHYNTLQDRENTGVGGASMGGAISFYMALAFPEVFGYAMCLSPALFLYPEDALNNELDKLDIKNFKHYPRMYLYSGGNMTGDILEGWIYKCPGFADEALIKRGWPVEDIACVTDTTKLHNNMVWKHIVPQAYRWMRKIKPYNSDDYMNVKIELTKRAKKKSNMA